MTLQTVALDILVCLNSDCDRMIKELDQYQYLIDLAKLRYSEADDIPEEVKRFQTNLNLRRDSLSSQKAEVARLYEKYDRRYKQ